MIRLRYGEVVKIIEDTIDIQYVIVAIEGRQTKAVNYPLITGKLMIGDKVQLNTTANSLNLGTGGYHFVLANLGINFLDCCEENGHIMKMRYTPQQVKVLAVEEEASPLREKIEKFTHLNNTPVLIGFLHSILMPTIAGIKAVNPNLKISYIMTDGGALPIAFSKTIKKINSLRWLEGTVTVGHAFGGDLEAVNIYSGLAAAHAVHNADIVVVAMGPGIVGTGTELGTTALEVGQIINAVHSLKGSPIVIPRLSFMDARERHKGISHHVATVLNKIALAKSTIVFPHLENKEKLQLLTQQITKYEFDKIHNIVFENGSLGFELLNQTGLNPTTMGRSIVDEKEFFLTACAAGTYGAKLLQ